MQPQDKRRLISVAILVCLYVAVYYCGQQAGLEVSFFVDLCVSTLPALYSVTKHDCANRGI